MKFSPIDTTEEHFHRRLLIQALPVAGRVTRRIWRWSDASRSTWHEHTPLWQSIWALIRGIGQLPRVHSHEIEVQLGSKVRMRLDLARLNDDFAFCYGVGESEIAYALTLLCHREAIVLDIGANIGSTALAFAEWACGGKVYAFEPSSTMCHVLSKNAALSGLTNIEILPFGLSDVPSRGRLQVAMAGNPGSAYFVQDDRAPEVELKMLDEVFGNDRQVDFVKIDVEGFEHRVLRGGWRLFSCCKPVLVVEINESALRRAGATGQQLANLLNEWGYRLLYLCRGRFADYVPETHLQMGIHNVVAVHPDSTHVWDTVAKHRLVESHERH